LAQRFPAAGERAVFYSRLRGEGQQKKKTKKKTKKKQKEDKKIKITRRICFHWLLDQRVIFFARGCPVDTLELEGIELFGFSLFFSPRINRFR